MSLSPTARVILTLLSLAADISTIITWIVGVDVEILAKFGVPIFSFLIMFFTGLILWANWVWIDGCRPTTRFVALHDEIHALATKFSPEDPQIEDEDVPSYQADIGSLRYRLARLGIYLPYGDRKEAVEVLTELLTFSRDGRIREAKEYTEEYEYDYIKNQPR